MNSIILPAGSVIFRARNANDKSPMLQANECQDTGKIGLYFADNPTICLGMALEYSCDIDWCTYVTTAPIVLYEGKYSFRGINPRRYFRPDGSFICNVDLLVSENINHFDSGAVPIYENVEAVHKHVKCDLLGEIFISETDLDKLEVTRIMPVSLDQAREILLSI